MLKPECDVCGNEATSVLCSDCRDRLFAAELKEAQRIINELARKKQRTRNRKSRAKKKKEK